MLSKSSTVLAMSGLVRVGRVPDVVVRLFAQRPPLILPAVFAARAHHIHPDARVTFDNDRSKFDELDSEPADCCLGAVF